MIKNREFRGACIGFTILFMLCFEFIIQKAWIGYLEFDSKKQISQCVILKTADKREACFIKYVERRNDKAEESVNNYLFLIVAIICFSFLRTIRIKKREKKKC